MTNKIKVSLIFSFMIAILMGLIWKSNIHELINAPIYSLMFSLNPSMSQLILTPFYCILILISPYGPSQLEPNPYWIK